MESRKASLVTEVDHQLDGTPSHCVSSDLSHSYICRQPVRKSGSDQLRCTSRLGNSESVAIYGCLEMSAAEADVVSILKAEELSGRLFRLPLMLDFELRLTFEGITTKFRTSADIKGAPTSSSSSSSSCARGNQY
ncbi:hypothetical protein GYMLUDRAFT_247692 [Collybiopsis luxurians FD-317 M1]|uniref:Uncharacterized protein n=1 Tax=Collybiopsis luxurians FD-317 M1 TaxID=944289 RepID=A0A0D0B0R4_9AGAR|nr:hypothetical protein GYMLUDRAFT_247692 [Collybiopsis luxurians FD-317 M1]